MVNHLSLWCLSCHHLHCHVMTMGFPHLPLLSVADLSLLDHLLPNLESALVLAPESALVLAPVLVLELAPASALVLASAKQYYGCSSMLVSVAVLSVVCSVHSMLS